MKAKKIFGLIATILMALPLFIGVISAGNVANAQETSPTEGHVNVTLHKRVWKDNIPEGYPKQNTGEIMRDFGGDPLEGAEFTVYDVTVEYHRLMGLDGATQQGTISTMVSDAVSGKPDYAVSIPDGNNTDTKGVTDVNGEFTFQNLPLKKTVGTESKDAVYLFIETDAPIDVREKAAPIVLAMPIYTVGTDENPSELNRKIHLYPKNIIKEDVKEITNIEAVIKDEEGREIAKNVNIGDEIEYKITVHVPKDIANFETFSVQDIPSSGLKLIPRTISVSDPLVDEDYTIYVDSTTTGGFTVAFDTEKGIVESAGSSITISYSMVLTGDIDPDKIFDNKAVLTIGNKEKTIPGPSVATGGHQFIKTDAHRGTGLAGAEFVVKNATDQYAIFETNNQGEHVLNDGAYVFTGNWSDDITEATTITSGEEGVLNIKGFVDGDYLLEETKAPSNDYVKLTSDVKFKVEHGKYGLTDLVTEVANTPKGLLPETGGNGILAFLAIGLSLMLGAFVWYKKTKKPMEV